VPPAPVLGLQEYRALSRVAGSAWNRAMWWRSAGRPATWSRCGKLAAALPADLPAPVLVTIHVGEGARTELPSILSRAGPLPTVHATAGERLQPGRIYVAPPGCHLLLPGGVAELSNGPRVSYSRPAVDVMFASAARWFGDRVIAVVLSGGLDDGAVGAALVTQAGGLVVVQEPGEAAHPSMPQAA